MTVPNRPTQGQELAYTPHELREVLKIGRDQVYTLLRSGELRSLRVGRRYIVPRDAVERWLKGKK